MLQAVAVALHNPEGFRTFGQARLDVGQVLPERMTDESYRELLVSCQIQDVHVLPMLIEEDCIQQCECVCLYTGQQPQSQPSMMTNLLTQVQTPVVSAMHVRSVAIGVCVSCI